MNKQEYILYLFLLTDKSVTRITNKMLNSGFGVESFLANDKLSSSGSVSSVMCVKLTHNEVDEVKMRNSISTLLQDLEVPHFGGLLRTFSNVNGGTLIAGYLPKQTPIVSSGPYRTIGQIIPFPSKKDDGIIDE